MFPELLITNDWKYRNFWPINRSCIGFYKINRKNRIYRKAGMYDNINIKFMLIHDAQCSPLSDEANDIKPLNIKRA